MFSINIDEISRTPLTDMNLLRWVLLWSPILRDTISCIKGINKNILLKFIKQTHMVSSALIDYRIRNCRNEICFRRIADVARKLLTWTILLIGLSYEFGPVRSSEKKDTIYTPKLSWRKFSCITICSEKPEAKYIHNHLQY